MNVLIVVTHLLGTGHLTRALTLGRAFARDGHRVHVASGGMPVPHADVTGMTLIQLPPLRSDGTDFTRLLGPQGVADSVYLKHRQDALLACLGTARPDLLITELFPFGRRSLRAEFTALLTAAGARGILTLASVRDILAPPSTPAKAAWTDEMIAKHYAGVLVHSVEEIAPLRLSWPVSPALEAKLHYTGFVAPPLPQLGRNTPGAGEILVSAGGGRVGDRIFETAIDAAKLDTERSWRLLVGGTTQDSKRLERLSRGAPDNCHIEALRPDFRAMLMVADASVSMCGYNTALDILQTGVRAVLIPFDAGGEVEQSLRAHALGAQDGITVLTSDDVTPNRLRTALNDLCQSPARPPMEAGMDGADQTVRIAQRYVDAH